MQILRTHLRIAAHRYLRRFHQQHAHESVSLFADRSQPLMSARTVLPRNQPQITSHLLASLKPLHIAHGQYKPHRSDSVPPPAAPSAAALFHFSPPLPPPRDPAVPPGRSTSLL